MPSSDLPAVAHASSPLGDDIDDVLDEEEGDEEIPADDPALSEGLREISSLAAWTVSTYKPGCGVAALLSPSTMQFWQSDGPQPHLLNVHFFKRVAIVRLRMYLNIELDESYTPTRMLFLAGHSEYDVVEFAEWRAQSQSSEGPKGWVDVSLENCWTGSGGDEDDSSDSDSEDDYVLRCMFLQIRVLENNQNGKDTHIRGIQIWARDERDGKVTRRPPPEKKVLPTKQERRPGPLDLSDESWLEADMAGFHIR